MATSELTYVRPGLALDSDGAPVHFVAKIVYTGTDHDGNPMTHVEVHGEGPEPLYYRHGEETDPSGFVTIEQAIRMAWGNLRTFDHRVGNNWADVATIHHGAGWVVTLKAEDKISRTNEAIARAGARQRAALDYDGPTITIGGDDDE